MTFPPTSYFSTRVKLLPTFFKIPISFDSFSRKKKSSWLPIPFSREGRKTHRSKSMDSVRPTKFFFFFHILFKAILRQRRTPRRRASLSLRRLYLSPPILRSGHRSWLTSLRFTLINSSPKYHFYCNNGIFEDRLLDYAGRFGADPAARHSFSVGQVRRCCAHRLRRLCWK